MGVHQNLAQDQRRAGRLLEVGLQLLLALVISAVALSPRLLAAQTPASQTPLAQTTQAEPLAQAEPQTQQESQQEDDFFGSTHRRQIYEQSKLSTTNAVLYNLALPGLGNFYAEQYFYGGIAMSLMVFTLVFVGYGLFTEQSEFVWMGGATAAIAYTGSIGTSIQGVQDYNRKLREGLKLEGAFSSSLGAQTPFEAGPWSLPETKTVSVSFRF